MRLSIIILVLVLAGCCSEVEYKCTEEVSDKRAQLYGSCLKTGRTSGTCISAANKLYCIPEGRSKNVFY